MTEGRHVLYSVTYNDSDRITPPNEIGITRVRAFNENRANKTRRVRHGRAIQPTKSGVDNVMDAASSSRSVDYSMCGRGSVYGRG